jgi:hypothetical protein
VSRRAAWAALLAIYVGGIVTVIQARAGTFGRIIWVIDHTETNFAGTQNREIIGEFCKAVDIKLSVAPIDFGDFARSKQSDCRAHENMSRAASRNGTLRAIQIGNRIFWLAGQSSEMDRNFFSRYKSLRPASIRNVDLQCHGGICDERERNDSSNLKKEGSSFALDKGPSLDEGCNEKASCKYRNPESESGYSVGVAESIFSKPPKRLVMIGMAALCCFGSVILLFRPHTHPIGRVATVTVFFLAPFALLAVLVWLN